MEAETLAAIFGVGGTLVGAAVSTGAVIWQQRRAVREAERTYLLGLAEAAANEVIRLSYEIQDHFGGTPPGRSMPGGKEDENLQRLNREVEKQSLKFGDPAVRLFLERCYKELLIHGASLAVRGWPPMHVVLFADMRAGMGTVLRREPFPQVILENHPDPQYPTGLNEGGAPRQNPQNVI
ncbi:hypothetical protein ACEYXF_14920 [Streptomyces asiaticus]|uniref:hypothetical protein n=1 Tax=Streptomyces asiaticus TaxID=114695 RepID=UPI0039BE1AAE